MSNRSELPKITQAEGMDVSNLTSEQLNTFKDYAREVFGEKYGNSLEIAKALAISNFYLGKVYRRNGEAVVYHGIRVARNIARQNDISAELGERSIIVGLLHDVPEDGGKDKQKEAIYNVIEASFPDTEISQSVKLMVEDPIMDRGKEIGVDSKTDVGYTQIYAAFALQLMESSDPAVALAEISDRIEDLNVINHILNSNEPDSKKRYFIERKIAKALFTLDLLANKFGEPVDSSILAQELREVAAETVIKASAFGGESYLSTVKTDYNEAINNTELMNQLLGR